MLPNHLGRISRLFFLIGLTCCLLTGCKQQSVADAGEEAYADAFLYSAPEKFEPYLRQHPDNESVRENAIRYYAYRSQDFERLRFHTLQMATRHPSNFSSLVRNGTAFYIRPAYRQEVIATLEKQLSTRSQVTSQHYFNIAHICAYGAIPPPSEPKARKRFYSYFMLPETTVLPTKMNQGLANKAIRYYYKAVETARKNKSNPLDHFYIGFSADSLASLLLRQGRAAEAIRVCEEALPDAEEVSKPDLLLTYGFCLKKMGKTDRAETTFKQVRQIDGEGSVGPGGATMKAETELGLLALKSGNKKQAAEYLLSSLNVKANIFNIRTRDGLPANYRLAQKLLQAGRPRPVITYCQHMLRRYPAYEKVTSELLQAAQKIQNKN